MVGKQQATCTVFFKKKEKRKWEQKSNRCNTNVLLPIQVWEKSAVPLHLMHFFFFCMHACMHTSAAARDTKPEHRVLLHSNPCPSSLVCFIQVWHTRARAHIRTPLPGYKKECKLQRMFKREEGKKNKTDTGQKADTFMNGEASQTHHS